MQTLYILCGLIGSGKSTWAKEKAKEKNTIIINKDSIRSMLKGEYFYDTNYESLVRNIAKLTFIESLYNGFNIIIDETNLTKSKRSYWIDVGLNKILYNKIHKNLKKFKIKVIYFSENKNNVKNRMNNPRNISETEWKKINNGMKKIFEKPTLNEFSKYSNIELEEVKSWQ